MSYSQFGYSAYPPASQLMVGSQAGSTPGTCCEPSNASDSLASAYDPCILSTYGGRLPGSTFYSTTTYPAESTTSSLYPPFNSAYGVKDNGDPWRGIPPTSYYYADPTLSAYGYGGLDLNSARRKNVTRDSTTTLKAWLNEHRKNPYPTKGEKIMLAIITKMTLTQVSTWFANARRRLKKENKMTWEPRNRCDEDDLEDGNLDNDKDSTSDEELDQKNSEGDNTKKTDSTLSETKQVALNLSDSSKLPCSNLTKSSRPQIWSIVDIATSSERSFHPNAASSYSSAWCAVTVTPTAQSGCADSLPAISSLNRLRTAATTYDPTCGQNLTVPTQNTSSGNSP